ncbi:hypothetical protein S40288_05948 [Stachybotrys chartarum IBT 40288]|nr:hypothetical protein S40288_05948 [Stachybotrys chartarum IBT 40288]
MDDTAPGSESLQWTAKPSPWPGMPAYSRAYEKLSARTDFEGALQAGDNFFIPSYLQASDYVRKLQEAHKAKLQSLKDSKPSSGVDSSNRFSALPPSSLPLGSHRGMSHTIIERQPFSIDDDDDDSLAPLPSRWNKEDMGQGIELQPDDLGVKFVGLKSPIEHEASVVRADHYMPPQCGVYYFEVSIVAGKREDCTICVGFSTKAPHLERPVGWEPESWGYHGDDGRAFPGQNVGRTYGPKFHYGDTIGCGVNFHDNTAFFTKNGVRLNVAFHDIAKGKLYPAVSLKKPNEQIRANFGESPFMYNIDDIVREQQLRVARDIDHADTSRLEPGLNETELVQNLVLQFLQHDGYVETARAFAQDIQAQKVALNTDPNVKIDGLNIKDDEDANNRQRIRKAILEGDVDKALKYTNAFYPQVLQDNEQVYFRLQCRRFVEMVRKAAYLNMKRGLPGLPMDIDKDTGDAVAWGDEMETDQGESQSELPELERKMLEYGQTLQAQYANDPRKEISNTLNEIWALLAYKNPLKEPQVSHLLDRNGRVAVAEELNSAILLSLGKSSRAALEKVYAQTHVLLEDLRQEGGDGAFASLHDIMNGVPKAPDL